MPRQPILKFAFINAAFIYMVVAWFVCRQPLRAPNPTGNVQSLAMILGGVYLFTILVAPLVVRRFPPGSNTRMVVALALYESGAVYGLMLSILSHQADYTYYFAAASVALMLLLA